MKDFVTYRHLAFDLFLPGIVNHSRIRGAVHYVKSDIRKRCTLVVVVLFCVSRLSTLDGGVKLLYGVYSLWYEPPR